MRTIGSTDPRLAGSRGVTLIETMVAATVLGLAFVGTTSMLASGKELETGDYLRRQAFRIALNILEDPAYGPRRYSALATGPIPRLDDSLRSEAGQRINAPVFLTVSAPMTEIFQDPTSQFSPGQPVNFKRIDVKVTWRFAGIPDSISLSKRISDIP